MGITKHTSTKYHIVFAESDAWLSEEEAKQLHVELTKALGIAPPRNEYVDTDGDVWAEQTNGTWYIREWSNGDSNVYDAVRDCGGFNAPVHGYEAWESSEAVEIGFPGGTWR